MSEFFSHRRKVNYFLQTPKTRCVFLREAIAIYSRLTGIAAIVVIYMFTWLSTCAAAGQTEKHILLLNAYTPDYLAVEAYTKGIKAKFGENTEYSFTYSYEYFNLPRFPHDSSYLEETARYLKVKYSQQKPDLIITQDTLVSFMTKYGQEIFPGIPSIALQGRYGDSSDKMVKPSPQLTLLPEIDNYAEKNIQLILKSKPLTQKIYVIIGDSAFERTIVQKVAAVTKGYADKVQFVFVNKLSYQEMLAAVKSPGREAAILYLLWLCDRDGINYAPNQAIESICREAEAPVYSVGMAGMGSGIVGGYIYNWELVGKNAAEAGLAILNGENPEEHSATLTSEYVFDWRILKRWGIEENNLPPGSRIEFKKYSLWEQYGKYLIFGVFLLLAQTVLIFKLLLSRRQLTAAYNAIAEMSERLSEQDKMKDVFLTNTSHEFQTPLHGILNITRAVLEDPELKINPEHKENLQLVVSLARRLSALVRDIVDFAKIKNNEIDLVFTSVDVQAAVNTTFEVFRHIIKDGGVTLVNKIPDSLPPVYADENRLLQVLYNLTSNAVKFTSAGQVMFTAAHKDGFLYISASDTGIGIPADKHDEIFCSFEQVSASQASQYGGSGLGLTITRQLVERMGGRIWLACSEVNKGSEFTFTLPVGRQEALAAPMPMRPPAVVLQSETGLEVKKSGDFTILAVDDEPTNLRIILNTFAQEKYDIMTATSGQEALRLIKETDSIDLVLLDVMMPGMTGYEVCRQLRREHSLFELPILLVTVNSMPEDVATGFAAGANDFIVKPFNSKEVRTRVNTLLELKKAAEDTIRAEVAFLQSQIKPHFFYNVLNSIIACCYTDSIKAAELLTEFCSYLRSSFAIQDTKLFTSLQKELELVKTYVAIETARFGDRIQVNYDIDEDLLNWQLPPLIIQPLVENALRHGLMKKEEGGQIQVSICKDAEDMVIRVVDDGGGMSPQVLAGILREKRGGVGLLNINRRLLKFYHRAFVINSTEGQGTSVEMRIPHQTGKG